MVLTYKGDHDESDLGVYMVIGSDNTSVIAITISKSVKTYVTTEVTLRLQH